MKFIVVICVLVQFAHSKLLPDYLQELMCRKSDPKYEKCLFESFEKSRPYLIKGIPELNVPPIDPFELPLLTVNRTLNELVSINAVMKNIKMIGGSNMAIEYLKANQENMTGEVRFTLPSVQLTMEYNVKGQLLIVPLRSHGYFTGNFTDTQIYLKGSVKHVDKNGVKYFRVDKLSGKMTVGDGAIKLKSYNPEFQLGADLIANFYNQNPRLVMDAVNPIFVETSTDFYRVVMDQILGSVPAKEFLPE